MASPWHRSLLSQAVILGFIIHTQCATGAGFYPCHPSKASPNTDVKCTRVSLPPDLCSSCKLRPTNPNGEFVDCANIYDVTSLQCHSALRRYTSLNTCDHVRKFAVESYLDDFDDNSAREVIDYFLYSVCENCCDCLPMGRIRSDYAALLLTHTTSNPTLWKENRGNCPAHAVYDVCQVLPNVGYFSNEGDPNETVPPACPQLNEWLRSPAASGWQTNPESEITNGTRDFLRGLLQASRCSEELIWTRCYDMEESQDHLKLPDGVTLPPVTTTTTTTITTVFTTTTAGITDISSIPTTTMTPALLTEVSVSPSQTNMMAVTASATPVVTPDTIFASANIQPPITGRFSFLSKYLVSKLT